MYNNNNQGGKKWRYSKRKTTLSIRTLQDTKKGKMTLRGVKALSINIKHIFKEIVAQEKVHFWSARGAIYMPKNDSCVDERIFMRCGE